MLEEAFPNLVELDLSNNTEITDTTVNYLCNNRNYLTLAGLKQTCATDYDQLLRRMTKLQTVRLDGAHFVYLDLSFEKFLSLSP